MFGLETPVEPNLFVPWEIEDDPDLMRVIPWKERNVLFCTSSDSPRKQMQTKNWEKLARQLSSDGATVVLAGRRSAQYIRGCYSLLGLTTVRQIVSLAGHFDVVVTSDSFLMHIAHLRNIPAVVLWGPTDHRIYGYPKQVHLQAVPSCAFPKGCIGPSSGRFYGTKCPEIADHCMDQIDVESIYLAVRRVMHDL
jgi:ADP-heptose:LPS heptosyltransferase